MSLLPPRKRTADSDGAGVMTTELHKLGKETAACLDEIKTIEHTIANMQGLIAGLRANTERLGGLKQVSVKAQIVEQQLVVLRAALYHLYESVQELQS